MFVFNCNRRVTNVSMRMMMMMMVSRPKCILVSFVGRQEAVQNTKMVRYNGFGERLISFVKLFSDAGVVFYYFY